MESKLLENQTLLGCREHFWGLRASLLFHEQPWRYPEVNVCPCVPGVSEHNRCSGLCCRASNDGAAETADQFIKPSAESCA